MPLTMRELAGLGDAYTQIAERTKACLASSGWDHFVPPRGGFVRADLFANPGTGMGVGVFVERQVTPWIDRSGSGDFHLYLRMQKMSP